MQQSADFAAPVDAMTGNFRDSWTSVSRFLVTPLLALALIVPLVCTLSWTAVVVNRWAAILLLLLAATRWPALDPRYLKPPMTHRIGACIVFAGLFLVVWQWQHGDLWFNGQFLLYCGIALSFSVCRDWFRDNGTDGLRLVFVLKLGSVLGAATLLTVASVLFADGTQSMGDFLRNPIVYRDLRHFNNDQLLVIAICTSFLVSAKSVLPRMLALVATAFMGYLLVWTAGRGAMLATGICLLLVAVFRVIPFKTLVWIIGALVFGFVFALVLGDTSLFTVQLNRTVTGEGMTSGRMAMWLGSIRVWFESWDSFLFGFGPDGFRRYVWSRVTTQPAIQPHNAFVQVVVEFGLLGLGLFTAMLAVVMKRVGRILPLPSAPREARIVAALLIAMSVYMLVDGILYHAIPLIFVALMCAYLFSLRLDETGGGRASMLTDSPSVSGPQKLS